MSAASTQPASSKTLPDTVHLVNLQLPPQRFQYLNDLWDRSSDISPQPANVTVEIFADLAGTAMGDGRDSLVGTVNYGTASKAILALVSAPAPSQGGHAPVWEGVEHLADAIADLLINEHGAPAVRLTLSLPRALLSCDAYEYVGEWATHRQRDGKVRALCRAQQYIVRSLRLNAIIGLNPCERQQEQPLVITLKLDPFPLPAQPLDPSARPAWNLRQLVSDISRFVAQRQSYGTVEALSTEIVRHCFPHAALTATPHLPTPKPQPRIQRITARVDKPSAVALASAAGAEVSRERDFFDDRPHSQPITSFFEEARPDHAGSARSAPDPTWWTALLSLGSNLGVRSAFLHAALRLLKAARKVDGASGRDRWVFPEPGGAEASGVPLCKVVDTSFMYETAPMYVEDQPRFLNAAARVQTRLPPFDFLDLTQTIEAKLGRDHAASLALPKGPRVVDLDIVWHEGAYTEAASLSLSLSLSASASRSQRQPSDAQPAREGPPPPHATTSSVLHTRTLTLPHPGLAEREFVLRPLADIVPRWRHPVHGRTVAQMLDAVGTPTAAPEEGMRRVLPLRLPCRGTASAPASASASASALAASLRTGTERTLPFPARTYVMSILNTTPDSFSDGGALHHDVPRAVRAAQAMLRAGADVLDVGGMSTAPGRPDVREEEEAGRVVPVVEAIRAAERAEPGEEEGAAGRAGAIISVDTFRPSVARAALDAGASLINDVTGARGDWSANDGDGDGDGDEEDIGPSNRLGDEMLALVAERGVPIVLMHMRGTSRTMTSAANTTYAAAAAAASAADAAVSSQDCDRDGDGVVAGVREELRLCVERALRAGVPRWNLVLDPGIGFAKTREGSLALVRRVGELTAAAHEPALVRACRALSRRGGGAGREDGQAKRGGEEEVGEEEDAVGLQPNLSLRNMPILLGPSRKRFLAPTTSFVSAPPPTTTGSEQAHHTARPAQPSARDRVFSTAAACAAGVAGGVDVVRVHDTAEMVDVVRTADAIWRV